MSDFAKSIQAFANQLESRAEAVLQAATENLLHEAGVEEAAELAAHVKAGAQVDLKVGDAVAAAREFGDGDQAPDFRLRRATQRWQNHVDQAVKDL